ncbi:hypothetical protein JOF48_002515 [Arthrobacter stackebrandtii]|uniref:Chemotaxis protein CheW n=1 Tax=Arthrobacter stackebrandtii TaxID=272161 RepID=A0ABS4YY23_9MICC|nr:hypothetical protein [Arthrobacter stackebrandtii]MBP2413716.1 hypothetical protein [Arthrobacter stackebrandtii]PYH00013.1 hypothetical protein CVV67_12615 [Arthrobacter stackebrandtii]
MRWEQLFADLEAQLHAASQQELEQRVNELARIEDARQTLGEALRGALGQAVQLVMRNGAAFHGILAKVECDWLLLREGERSVILPMGHIQRVHGLGSRRAGPPTSVPFTLAAALRILARNRAMVALELDGVRNPVLRGVLDQVGADFVQIMQLSDGVGRDSENRQGTAVVPFASLVAVTSSPENEF